MLNALTPEGISIFNHPAVLRDFAQLARTVNPTGTLVDGEIPTTMQSVDDELAELRKEMRQPGWSKKTAKHDRMQELLRYKEQHA